MRTGTVKNWIFKRIHQGNLIYNQCWEDPSVDKQALNLTATDRIVTITSAGCNALDYLLSDPERIDCVDVNPHQTALLELKLAALRTLSHPVFFKLFGEGRLAGHRSVYRRQLRPLLSTASRNIWDRKIDYFDPKGPGLYFHGTSGFFARLFNRVIDWKQDFRRDLQLFQTITDIALQRDFYRDRIAPRLWTPVLRWALGRQTTMSLLGVPAEQVRQIQVSSMDLATFIQDRVDRVFTEIPISENYFWRVYMNGRYTSDCCPDYLRPENFEILKARSSRVHPHTMTMTDFLKFNPQQGFTVYVLLDHMDWLASSDNALREEWQAILNAAAPGARIIYRSGGLYFDRVPEFATRRMEYRSDVTSALHLRDRVGTYGSFYLASLRG